MNIEFGVIKLLLTLFLGVALLTLGTVLTVVWSMKWISDEVKIPREWEERNKKLAEKIGHELNVRRKR